MDKFKLLITSHSFGSADNGVYEKLEQAGIDYEQIHSKEILREEDFLDIIEKYDGIIVGADKVTKKVIEKGNNLKIISKHGVGVDNIDMESAKERGITVAVALGANNVAVAELTVAMIYSLASGIVQNTNLIRSGEWIRKSRTEICGATIGVIGTGNIGKEVIKRMAACGMNILAYDMYEDKEFLNNYGGAYVELDELLKNSDFITIHIPFIDKTKFLINEDNIKLIKKSAYLINCSRGGIVDEKALYEALKAGNLRGAGIDTFEAEPPALNGIPELDNVVMTPHLGAYTTQAIAKMSNLSAEAVIQYATGQQVKNQINKKQM